MASEHQVRGPCARALFCERRRRGRARCAALPRGWALLRRCVAQEAAVVLMVLLASEGNVGSGWWNAAAIRPPCRCAPTHAGFCTKCTPMWRFVDGTPKWGWWHVCGRSHAGEVFRFQQPRTKKKKERASASNFIDMRSLYH